MVIKYITLAMLIVISITMIFSTCKKRFGCEQTDFSFKIGVKAYPDIDSVNVNDTLYLEINEPVNFKEVNNGATINFANAGNLGMGVSFLEILEGAKTQGAIDKFKIYLITGANANNNYDPTSLQEFLFKEEGAFYKFKIAVVAQKAGRFVITISNASNVYQKNNVCNKAFFEINYKETNQHFYFLQQWRPDLMLDDSGKKKVY